MSKGAKILIALALGGMAALFGMLYLNTQKAELLGSSQMVKVYVAADNIPPNKLIEPDMLLVREIPQTFLQPASITVTDVPDRSKIRGITLVPIQEGEQILRTKLFEGAPPSLASELKGKPSMLAVGIAMQGLPQSMHGLVKPGDKVDVLASFEFEREDSDPFTEIRPMFQNVEVLAVNDRTAGNAQILGEEKTSEASQETTVAQTVTLALPPAAAQQIVLAQQLGSIWLFLRAPGDKTLHKYEIWNNERLLQTPFRLWKARDTRAEVARDLARNTR